jgi:hypothetical protein
LSSSGESERSISESGIVAKRSQSVPDCFLELDAFIPGGLSHGNDSNFILIVILSEYYDGDNAFEKTNPNPPFLPISECGGRPHSHYQTRAYAE